MVAVSYTHLDVYKRQGVVYGSFFGFEMPFALISTTSNAMTILDVYKRQP